MFLSTMLLNIFIWNGIEFPQTQLIFIYLIITQKAKQHKAQVSTSRIVLLQNVTHINYGPFTQTSFLT